ncbi:hypothetical protein P4V41_20285 [Fictibacillus nanhaiensis]|uniref:hypothetical protein n=1 Tax=Fictibacillus nanhaiensis TaxID=742169 RepID=UPI002E240ED0|nr:hypothetical protein [Fictibacillus nanhaiensis]
MKKNLTVLNKVALLIIWTIYCISLMLPAFTTSDGDSAPGVMLVLMGGLGIFAGLLASTLSWYANLLFFYISVQTFRGKETSISHFFMLLLAFRSFFPWVMLLDEAGNTAVITNYDSGYYFWISSIMLLSTLVFINWFLCRKRVS